MVTSTVPAALWYKDAVIYQVHVRAFCDSNGDGIGDFRGFAQKLDYLQELGINTIWLMPFFPSPLRDDGYDISDYTTFTPVTAPWMISRFSWTAHATRDESDHRNGAESHLGPAPVVSGVAQVRRQSRAAIGTCGAIPTPATAARELFFSTPKCPTGPGTRFPSRITGTASSATSPILNYDNPAVREEMWNVMKFWLDMGVDGFRLDAVPYLVEREGTSCENLPETHAVLKDLRRRLDREYPGKIAAGRSQPVARRSAGLFRRRR